MKEKQKYIKRIVSIICILAMLFHLPYPQMVFGANEQETEFLDVTFSDYIDRYTESQLQGVYDGTDEVPVALNGHARGLKNLDGVAFNGRITFQDTDEAIAVPEYDSVRIGGLDEGKTWLGLTIFYDGANLVLKDNTSATPVNLCTVTTEQAGTLVDTPLDIRLTCQYEGTNDARITFSIGGNTYYDAVCSDMADKLGPWMVVTSYVRAVTVESVYQEDTTPYRVKSLTEFVGLMAEDTLGETAAEETSGNAGIGSLENLMIEGEYQLSASSNMIYMGGTWSGFYIQTNLNNLLFRFNDGTQGGDVQLGAVSGAEIGEFAGTSIPIHVGFAFSNKTETTADVTIHVQIKGEYEFYYHVQAAPLAKLVDTVHLYAAANNPLSYSSVGYQKLTIDDFGMAEVNTITSTEIFAANISSFDHVIVEGYYTFSHTPGSNAVYFGNTWAGLRVENSAKNTLGFIQIDSTDSVNPTVETIGEIKGDIAGLELEENSFHMQVAFSYEEPDADVTDVKVSVVIDHAYRTTFVMKDMHTAVLAGKIFLWALGDETPLTVSVGLTPSPKLLEVTPSDFGISDDTYEYNKGDLSVRGSLVNYYTNSSEMTMQGKILSMDVSFPTTGSHIRIGGNDGMGWNGVMFARVNDTQFQFAPTEEASHLETHTVDIGATNLTNITDEFNLKISFEYVDHDGGGTENDVRFGVWINNRLYKETYLYSLNDATYYGNWLGIYCPTDGNSICISSPKRTISSFTTPYILEDFGVKERTYDQNYINELGAIDSYSRTEEIDMDDVSLSGRIGISAGADIRLFSKGANDNLWEGYRFYIGSSGSLQLEHSCYEDTNGDNLPESTVSLALTFPEITAEDMFDFTLTQDFVDADADGSKDDVQLGVWINGKMHENRYYYLLDFANYVQGSLLIYPTTNGKVIVEDSVDSEIYNLANTTSKEGYLIAGKGNLSANKIVKENGDVLKESGDYIVRSADKGTYVRKIVLYKSGDAHPDEVMNSKDLVAAKKVTQDILLDTESGTKAADVDGDSKTDDLDCDRIRKHLIGEESIVPAQDNYVAYDEDVMPIGGFYAPYDKTVTDGNYGTTVFHTLNEETFQMIQDLGVNLITYIEENFVTNADTILTNLALGEKYGVDIYLYDGRITSSACDKAHLATCMADYMEYDSFKGFSVVDEPNTEYYGNEDQIKEKVKLLADYAPLAQAVNGYCNINGSVNLYPKTTTEMQSTKPSAWTSGLEYNIDNVYEAYVEDYIGTYKPKVLSADFYVFDHLITNSTWKTIEGYFDNLEVLRKNSLEHNLAFWNYIQAGSWFFSTERGKTDNDLPTEGQMYWNVNTSLAYGAKGILYFPLVQPYYFGREKTGNVQTGYSYSYDYKRNGLIGADGNETSWYPWAQNANVQIQEVDEVLMHTTSKDVLAVGAKAQEKTEKTATQEQLKLYGLESITATNGAVIGVFEYQGKTAFYVVNYDYDNAQDITLTFDESQNYSVISTQLKEAHTETSGNSCKLSLVAGGAAMVTIN